MRRLTWLLYDELDIDSLVWLQPHHQLVAHGTRIAGEQEVRRLLELDSAREKGGGRGCARKDLSQAWTAKNP